MILIDTHLMHCLIQILKKKYIVDTNSLKITFFKTGLIDKIEKKITDKSLIEDINNKSQLYIRNYWEKAKDPNWLNNWENDSIDTIEFKGKLHEGWFKVAFGNKESTSETFLKDLKKYKYVKYPESKDGFIKPETYERWVNNSKKFYGEVNINSENLSEQASIYYEYYYISTANDFGLSRMLLELKADKATLTQFEDNENSPKIEERTYAGRVLNNQRGIKTSIFFETLKNSVTGTQDSVAFLLCFNKDLKIEKNSSVFGTFSAMNLDKGPVAGAIVCKKLKDKADFNYQKRRLSETEIENFEFKKSMYQSMVQSKLQEESSSSFGSIHPYYFMLSYSSSTLTSEKNLNLIPVSISADGFVRAYMPNKNTFIGCAHERVGGKFTFQVINKDIKNSDRYEAMFIVDSLKNTDKFLIGGFLYISGMATHNPVHGKVIFIKCTEAEFNKNHRFISIKNIQDKGIVIEDDNKVLISLKKEEAEDIKKHLKYHQKSTNLIEKKLKGDEINLGKTFFYAACTAIEIEGANGAAKAEKYLKLSMEHGFPSKDIEKKWLLDALETKLKKLNFNKDTSDVHKWLKKIKDSSNSYS